MIGVGDFVANEDTIANVNKVLASGRISYGPYCQQFEHLVAGIHGNKFGVLSNSGTSSLLVALQTLKELHGWEDGDEVIIPAATFVATLNIVLQCGLKPVLVDVDPVHYLIDPVQVERKIGPRTRAIIPVHTFGQPADMVSCNLIAKQHGLKVIEDSCECFGLPTAGISNITVFSFYVAHILTTGVGGMAITDNDDYATCMRSLVNHGRNNIYISIDDTNPDRLAEVLGKRFQFERVGHSFRITELEAAIGVSQLIYIKDWLDKRRTNAMHLLAYLRAANLDSVLQLPSERVERQHAWMMVPLVCRDRATRDRLALYLEEHGVETRETLPLVTQPVYLRNGLILNPDLDWPIAYQLATCGFYVGCHQYLTLKQMEYIADVIRGFFHES